MKPVYLINAKLTPEQLAHARKSNPQLADLMAAGLPDAVFRSKRSADRCEADWRAAGWIVTRKVMQRAESLEEAFMTLIGVPA